MPESYEERIELPGGDVVWFIDEHPTNEKLSHSYWADSKDGDGKGRRLSGVTTVVKTLDYSVENLLKWAARTQCEGVAQLYLREPEGEFHHWLVSAEEMWSELNRNGLTYDNVRAQAGDEGTNVHMLVFEALAAGSPGIDFDALSDREKQLAKAVSMFWFEHDPNASQVEQVVYSKRLRVAGRLDFRGRLQARCANPLCACHEADGVGVIDLKTGGYISEGAHSQVGGGYPLLAEESGFGESGWAAILQVSDDGTYEFFKAEGTAEGFESAVETYREAGRIRGLATKGREARQVARDLEEQIDEAVEAMAA
jgi:hypothetical protein